MNQSINLNLFFLTAFLLSALLSKASQSAQNDLLKYRIYHVEGLGKFYLDERKDLIKDILRRGKVWEHKIVRLLKKHIKSGSAVVDAGAHIGTHTISMSKAVGAKGTVIAFEPQHKIFQELVVNVKLNGLKNVKTKNNALGNEEKWVRMYNVEAGNEAGMPICPPSATTCGSNVLMITLDSLLLSNVSLLKIDVEGSENIVLDGARRTIQQNRPVIIIEICGGIPLEKADSATKLKIAATKTKLKKMGYTVSRIDSENYLAIPKARSVIKPLAKALKDKNKQKSKLKHKQKSAKK